MRLTNAVLTAIAGPGTPDANGDAGVGADLWTGRASAYLKRERRTALSGGQQLLVKTDVLTILDTAGAQVAVAAAGAAWDACTIVVDDLRAGTPVSRRFRVKAAEHRAAGTIADSVRLELVAEGAAG